MRKKTKQLGQILIEQGLLTEDQLEAALAEQQHVPKSLGRILIDLRLIREIDLVRALAHQIGLEFVDLSEYPIDPTVASLIPESVAKRYRAMPIGERDDRLLVAMSDPANVYALDDIRTITGREVQPLVATSQDINDAINKYTHMSGAVEQLAQEASDASEEAVDLDMPMAAVEDAPIVKLVHMLLTRAVAERASDLHIEPMERDVRIRFRVDGVLHEVMRSPKNIQGALISRLKVMADINIAERRMPQDGRVSLRVGSSTVDLRLATLPTVHGEKVVIRILHKESVLLRLDQLGFLDDAYKRFEQSFRKPYGTILVTGPTGSGKSTTLYATLNIINDVDRNIITVEDPVEYRLPGVNQIQVNPKAGLTFAAALRSFLRADPDVILIGEIRDRAAVRPVQGAVHAYPCRAGRGGLPGTRLARDRPAVPQGRVCRLRAYRIPRPDRHVRGGDGHRGDRAPSRGTCLLGPNPRGGSGTGNDPAPPGRAGQGPCRDHVDRGSAEGGGMTW